MAKRGYRKRKNRPRTRTRRPKKQINHNQEEKVNDNKTDEARRAEEF